MKSIEQRRDDYLKEINALTVRRARLLRLIETYGLEKVAKASNTDVRSLTTYTYHSSTTLPYLKLIVAEKVLSEEIPLK